MSEHAEQKSQERVFLHDISNPLSIAMGMLEIVISEAKSNPAFDAALLARMEKSLAAMERAVNMLKARRKILKDEVLVTGT